MLPRLPPGTQQLSAEAPVQGVAELGVPVAQQGALVGGGVAPAIEHREGFGEGIESALEHTHQHPHPGLTANAEPVVLKGLGDGIGLVLQPPLLPVRPRLFDEEPGAHDVGVDGGVLCAHGRSR